MLMLLTVKRNALMTIALMVCCQGCSAVAPWERGRLAKPQMAIIPHPNQAALRHHQYGSREAGVTSSTKSSGGGCGCY